MLKTKRRHREGLSTKKISGMRSEEEVHEAMRVVLQAAVGSQGDELAQRGNAAMAMTLAWILGSPKEVSDMFQEMLDQCREFDKPLRHRHGSGPK